LVSCVAGVTDSSYAFQLYGCYGPKPAAEIIGNDTTICSAEGPISLSANPVGGNILYEWSNGSTTQSIDVFTSGNYTVMVTDTSTECSVTEGPVNITILQTPEYDIPDDTICPEVLPYTLLANVQGGATVTWSTGSTGIFTTVNQAGTYWATYEATNGCTGSDTMTLTVQTEAPPTFIPGSTIDLCEGDEVIVSTQDSYTSYQWGNANDTNTVLSSDSTIVVDEGGNYWLRVIAQNGCEAEGDFTVVDRLLPMPTISQSFTVNGNVSLTTASNYDEYQWSSGDDTKTITVTENGVYTVTVIDEYGCEGTATINIQNVGIEDPLARAFGFFPNPTNGLLQFTWPEYNEESHLHVLDASGRTVRSLSSSSGIEVIDLSDLNNGVYFIQVLTPQGEGKMKIVKQ
jgi:hypothetical protein